MKILITGGAGFIGSNIVDGYIKEGHNVIVVDNLNTGRLENVNHAAKFYETDVRSKELGKIFDIERPEIVNHHAAQISVCTSIENPEFDADVNIIGLINVLQCSIKYDIKKIIFASSGGAVYGNAEEYPTSENYQPIPLSPYAIAKLASEHYLEFYKYQYGLAYTVLRYANIYGPRQMSNGEAGVVAIFLNNLMSGKTSVIYHFPENLDGMERDYCYVGDVVNANIYALGKGSGAIFNIGTGKPTKTIELYNMLYELTNSSNLLLKNPAYAPARPGDVRRSCLNAQKAEKILGWIPKYSLRAGLQKTAEWYSNNKL